MKKILFLFLLCLVLAGCGGSSDVSEDIKDKKEIIISEKEITSFAYDVSEYLVYSCDMYFDEHITKDELYERLIQIDTSLIDYQARKESKEGNFDIIYFHGGLLVGVLEQQEAMIKENRDEIAELIEFDKY